MIEIASFDVYMNFLLCQVKALITFNHHEKDLSLSKHASKTNSSVQLHEERGEP